MGYSTPVRLCSHNVSVDWDGQTWLGAGPLGQVEAVRESSGEIVGLQFQVTGVPTSEISLTLTESARGKPCQLYMGILDPDTHAVLDAPLIFPGILDQTTIQDDPTKGTSAIAVSAIHMGKLMSRIKSVRYTDVDQQKLYPGDTSLRFITSQANHQDVWPAAAFFKQ